MRIPTLVLSKFTINDSSNGDPCLQLIGRPGGLIAWLLTVMGLKTTTTLEITDLCVSIKTASLSGELKNFIPLPHVSSTHCGFSKPTLYLVCAAIAALAGLVMGMSQRDGGATILVGFVLALIFAGAYVLSKKIAIEIMTDGGLRLRLLFKPSVIEGVRIDINYTTQALSLLNDKVLQAA